MSRTFRSLGLAALAALVAYAPTPLAAQTPDLSGEWTLSWETPRGDRSFEVTLDQTDMTFSGVAAMPQGEAPVEDGSIDGDRVKFTLSLAMGGRGGRGGGAGDGQGRTMQQTFEGVLADGVITGELTMSGMGGRGGGGGDRTFPFTMRRVEG